MAEKKRNVIMAKAEVKKWIDVANVFAKSLISENDALKDFNKLSAADRISIRKEVSKYDELRKRKIPKTEMDSNWEMSVMVDSHIIATEFKTNPLVVMMCVNPPCKPNERILCR